MRSAPEFRIGLRTGATTRGVKPRSTGILPLEGQLEEIMAEVKIRSGNDEKVIDREPPPEVGKTISLGGRQWLVLSVSFLVRKAA
jgi:hypothetical protein